MNIGRVDILIPNQGVGVDSFSTCTANPWSMVFLVFGDRCSILNMSERGTIGAGVRDVESGSLDVSEQGGIASHVVKKS